MSSLLTALLVAEFLLITYIIHNISIHICWTSTTIEDITETALLFGKLTNEIFTEIVVFLCRFGYHPCSPPCLLRRSDRIYDNFIPLIVAPDPFCIDAEH